ncbi:MAG: hypothetical protein C0467_11105 [Planctomycetaceae bacterium]|nr:hypothetical protein [Planctomycetaceae bacterium]
MGSPCPPPERFDSLFNGARPPLDGRVILAHLEQCPACRDVVATRFPGLEVPSAFRPAEKSESPVATATGTHETANNTINAIFDTGSGGFSACKPKPAVVVPRRLGTYEILRVLGRGGMGMVLKALDPALNRFVAVKILFPHLASNETYRLRFAREARSAAKIGSDHATAVFAVGEDGDAPYIVMEYVSGEDLETRLNREGRLPLPLAINIARQVAAGLAAAHAEGVVHRDIKPGNILLEPLADSEQVRVKITDFGIARSMGSTAITGAEETVGTPEYMAPEQISGDPLDHRCDLYSFGILLYRLVTARLPFAGKTAIACFTQHLSLEPPKPTKVVADLPEWLESLILRLLRKDPAERIQTASEVVRLLDEGAARLLGPPTDPESRRLAALRSYQVLDTASEQSFDDLTFLASHICGTPIALVSFIDEDRQWFKSKVGLSAIQTARNVSFCQYTIRGTEPMIVGNAATDPRFQDNPVVVNEPHIRFYAGVPLIDTEGCALGSLCVVDRVVRGMSPEQIAALSALGRLVMNQLTLRRELLNRREKPQEIL